MINTFFISDTHAGHGNIIKQVTRSIFANAEEKAIIFNGDSERKKQLKISPESLQKMDNALIENWNGVVGKDDIVYHLGDIVMHKDIKESIEWLSKLNGKIRLVRGNHDNKLDKIKDRFEWVKDYHEAAVFDRCEDGKNINQHIFLCHYAMKVWNNSHRGNWHLYGHSHHSLAEDPFSLSFDVGVDGWNFTPLSYEQVKHKILQKRVNYKKGFMWDAGDTKSSYFFDDMNDAWSDFVIHLTKKYQYEPDCEINCCVVNNHSRVYTIDIGDKSKQMNVNVVLGTAQI